MFCCLSQQMTHFPSESQMFASHAESAHLCPLPSIPPMMCSLSHLFYTVCGANNTVQASISPTLSMMASPSANVSQFRSCQLFVWSCDLSVDGFRPKFVGILLKWKWYYDFTSHDVWLNYFCSVFSVCQKSRVCGLLSALSNGHAASCSVVPLGTTRNKVQESSWQVSQ